MTYTMCAWSDIARDHHLAVLIDGKTGIETEHKDCVAT
ncbi:hypothetical protein JV46_08730 [Solemya velum gill symbiont]|uniref:Uncharacterized protein n=1 Tax=Solemya velum gill symbiont TaxID=2340 RepID=A0A0B0H423_SOVGS|nr:hypothetical protein JV46_08730 [Solemya velum gill symbiont]